MVTGPIANEQCEPQTNSPTVVADQGKIHQTFLITPEPHRYQISYIGYIPDLKYYFSSS